MPAHRPPTTVVLPVVVDDAVAGVLLMRGQESAPRRSARRSSAWPEASPRWRRARSKPAAAQRRPAADGLPALDRRLQEELERARRYSLSLSLVLLDVDPPRSRPGRSRGARTGSGRRSAAEIRRELRLPDFVSGYGDGEFAVVLPETAADGARRSVRAAPASGSPSTSAGIVAYPHPSVAAPDDLFALVEAALRRGRAQAGERIGVAD